MNLKNKTILFWLTGEKVLVVLKARLVKKGWNEVFETSIIAVMRGRH
jgi:hypothetical protein